MGRYEPLLGFWDKAPAAKRFPGYYRGLRERWMRESRCYFFYCYTPKKWGVRYPLSKKWGARVSYAYALNLSYIAQATFSFMYKPSLCFTFTAIIIDSE